MEYLLKNDDNEINNVELAPPIALNLTYDIHSKGVIMKLYYRGVSYEYDPFKLESQTRRQPSQPIRGAGHAYKLVYRGVPYRIEPNAKQSEGSVQPATHKLMYRGNPYLVNNAVQKEISIVTQATNASKLIRAF
ncbi:MULTISPECIES: DUF4278 domain-containing protein [Cyanophyceae]|uniref:DUF4278 domain-containing protein n=1 Tax=Cyanophyceae TaxID=3028117 RepID=UPI0018EF86A4|nr:MULTISPECIES: DUF4278 domain-containing protein [Cyanophyceae]